MLRRAGAYKIFNLCNERSYDISKFGDACATFAFEDHGAMTRSDRRRRATAAATAAAVAADALLLLLPLGAPPLPLVKAFCASAKSWLLGGMEQVVAIHCKAGKGRTGEL